MKIIVFIFGLLVGTGLIGAVGTTSAVAQNERQQGTSRANNMRLLEEAKLQQMRIALALTPTQYESFKPVFVDYDRATIRIAAQKEHPMPITQSVETVEQAEQIMRSQFDTAKKMLRIKELYLDKFKIILEPEQLIKFYQIENDIRNKIKKEFRSRHINKELSE